MDLVEFDKETGQAKDIYRELEAEIEDLEFSNEDNDNEMDDTAREFVSGSERNLPKSLYQDGPISWKFESNRESSVDMVNFCETNV